MSRTVKGSKGPGWEFWSKRPVKCGRGKDDKIMTHRIERQQGKQEVIDELDENASIASAEE